MSPAAASAIPAAAFSEVAEQSGPSAPVDRVRGIRNERRPSRKRRLRRESDSEDSDQDNKEDRSEDGADVRGFMKADDNPASSSVIHRPRRTLLAESDEDADGEKMDVGKDGSASAVRGRRPRSDAPLFGTIRYAWNM